MYTPYWQGNVIYNETVMLVDDGTTISGKLQYTPVKILSVRDYAWTTEYQAGKDYTISGNVISLGTDSAMPYLTEANLVGNDLPAGYQLVSSIANVETDVVRMGATIYTEGSLIYGHQVSVSYVYNPADIQNVPVAFSAPKTKAKLEAGEDVTIVTTGDSVMAGCSTSGYFNHEPYTETFMEMVKDGLETKYNGNVTLVNKAVGGKTSTWGATDSHIAELTAQNPDILFVHFGINDCGSGASKNMYKDNIEYIIMKVHDALPDCEIVLIKAFTPHPTSYDTYRLEDYWEKLDGLCAEYENVTALDMYSQSTEMLKVKKYMDVTGRCLARGLPKSVRVYPADIKNALTDPINQILDAITEVIDNTPPELDGDIVNNGILLTGGGSMLAGLSEVITSCIGVRVRIPPNAEQCVAIGAGRAMRFFSEGPAERALYGKYLR
jgi:lysophospholipase L1-like esterase